MSKTRAPGGKIIEEIFECGGQKLTFRFHIVDSDVIIARSNIFRCETQKINDDCFDIALNKFVQRANELTNSNRFRLSELYITGRIKKMLS
jgi:hypothetical protein